MVRIALVLLIAFAGQDPSEKAKELLKELDTLRGMAREMTTLQKQLEGMRNDYAAAMKAGDDKKMEELKAEFAKVQTRVTEIRAKVPPAAQALDRKLDAEVKASADDVSLLAVRAQLRELLGRHVEAKADAEAFLAKGGPADWVLPVADLLRRGGGYAAARKAVAPHLKDKPAAVATDALAAYCLDDFETAAKGLEQALQSRDAIGEMAEECERTLKAAKEHVPYWKTEAEIREKEAKADDNPIVILSTTKGDIEAELFENQAPNTVANFIELAERKFYDGLKFHRVIPNFMIQGGCPQGTGTGGPGYAFADEVGDGYRKHFRGTLSMANSGPNTNGSQFFVTHRPTEWLDGRHTAFGRVLKGMDVVDAIVGGDVLKSVTVKRKRGHEYRVTKLGK